MDRKWSRFPSCVALRAYFAEPREISQEKLAETLGVTPGLIYLWKVGERRPGKGRRDALERIIPSVTAAGWLTKREQVEEQRVDGIANGRHGAGVGSTNTRVVGVVNAARVSSGGRRGG